MHAIYALIDPDEIWKVCYIGITDNVYNRFTQHLRDTDNGGLKSQWLREMRDRNRVPYCRVLEEVETQEEARKREAYWIHFYKQLNMPLTNSVIPQVPQDATTEEQVKEIAVKATQDDAMILAKDVLRGLGKRLKNGEESRANMLGYQFLSVLNEPMIRDFARRLQNGESRTDILRSLGVTGGRARQEIGAALDMIAKEEEQS